MTTSEPHDPGDLFASARRFPGTLPAPSTGAEFGGPVKLYGQPAGSWPPPADAPATAPPPPPARGGRQ